MQDSSKPLTSYPPAQGWGRVLTPQQGVSVFQPTQRRHKGLRPPRLREFYAQITIYNAKAFGIKIDGKILPRTFQLPLYREEKSQSLNHSSDGTITLMQN